MAQFMKTGREINKKDLALLLDMKKTETVFGEVSSILKRMVPTFETASIRNVFDDIVSMYNGGYPGYRPCNIGYHDLRHTTDVFLCMARLIHGMKIGGAAFSEREIFLALVAALMHDAGYIQEEGDMEGTGAKYTKTHVQRSVAFMHKYLEKNGYSKDDFEFAKGLVLATSVDIRLGDIPFLHETNRVMGRMMFASDLIGQIADRIYLEKLLFLFLEFKEGGVAGYESEWDLLCKTRNFYEYVKKRLDEDNIDYAGSFKRHFLDKWNIDNNYYMGAMEGNIKDLLAILKESGRNYRSRLRRENIVKQIEERELMPGI